MTDGEQPPNGSGVHESGGGVEEVVEEAVEVYRRLDDQYLLAAAMVLASITVYAFFGSHVFGQALGIAVQGLTLVVILHASHMPRRLVRFSALVSSLAFAVVLASSLASGNHDGAKVAVGVVGALLAFVGPFAIVYRVTRRPRIDVMTVAGALCIYLLAGLFFAYIYALVDFANGPFFAQTAHPDGIDFVYFSFVTLTTVGYGDLTARTDAGRMLAVSEALIGQLYLVAVIALLIANLGRGVSRTPRATRAQRSLRRSRGSGSE